MGPSAFHLLLAVCAICAFSANSIHVQTSDDIAKDNLIFKKYVELDKSIKGVVNSGVKSLLPYILEVSEHVNVSSRCSSDIFRFISDVRNLKLAAFRLLDATAKVSDGFMSGRSIQFGDYDQCLTTRSTRTDGSIAYSGQYCMVYVKPILPRPREVVNLRNGHQVLREAVKNSSELLQYFASIYHYTYRYDFKFGFCVPSGCSFEDIDSIAKYMGGKIMADARVGYCDQQHDSPMSTGKIIAIFFFSLFGLFSIIGTSVDYYARKRDVTFQSTLARCIQCFSVLTNFPKIVSGKVTDKSMSSLFGIRSLSLFYIVLEHHYFFIEKISVVGHWLSNEEKIPGFFLQIIINGFLTTEVFIFLGGFLHSYVVLQSKEKHKRKISYVAMIIHRLLRIYPPYLFTMMSIYILQNDKGPLGGLVHQLFWKSCDKNWWHNLLFINNFFNQDDSCMFHSWYIAADMHLFLVSMFTVPVFLKNQKKGVLLHLGILVFGLLSTSLLVWYKDILPALIPYRINVDEINKVWNVYTTTFPHIAPYFAGILIGYVLSTYKDFKISLTCRLIGWPVAAVAFTSMLLMTQRWNSGVEPSAFDSVLYFSFSKLIYVLPVGWLIICCARGYGGILNYILSLKVWIPISKISYMMFLISPIIQTVYISHLRMTIDSDDVSMIWRYFGDLGVSFLMALAMTTIIESPFIAFEKLIFGRQLAERAQDLENTDQARVKGVLDENAQRAVELENNIKNTVLDLQLKE